MSIVNSKLILVVVAVVALLLGAGVGYIAAPSGADDDVAAPVPGLRDAAGNLIEVSGFPQRIVSTAPSATEMLVGLGVRDYIVGISNNCDDPYLVAKDLPKTGSYNKPNSEKIIDIESDVIFIVNSNQDCVATYEKVNAAGKTAVLLYAGESVDTIYNNIRIVEYVTAGLALEMKQIFDAVADVVDSADKLKAMVTLGVYPDMDDGGLSSVWAAGENTFSDAMLNIAGGKNVLSGISGYGQVSRELLLDAPTNPEVVFVFMSVEMNEDDYDSAMDLLKNDEAWKMTDAVQNDRVYFLSGPAGNLESRASPGVTDYCQLLALYMHPDLFGDPVLPNFVGSNYPDLIDLVTPYL